VVGYVLQALAILLFVLQRTKRTLILPDGSPIALMPVLEAVTTAHTAHHSAFAI
jgi:hypothetical protein